MAGNENNGELTTVVLARSFVRELNVARACTAELEIAVSVRDGDQVAAIVMSLYRAWGLAETTVSRLEALIADEHCHRFARDALRESHVLARSPLALAWNRLREHDINAGSRVAEAGREMARDMRDAEMGTTHELLGSVVRQMDSANACLSELEVALSTGDRPRLIAAAASLHDTWTLAEITVATMRERAARNGATNRERWHYKLARNTVLAWRYFSREPLSRTWAVLREDLERHGARSPLTNPGVDARMDESTRPDRPDPRAATGHVLAELQIACGALRAALDQQDAERVDIAANALASAWLVAKATIRMLEMQPAHANEEIRAGRLVLHGALHVMGELFARALAQMDTPKLRSVLRGLGARIRVAITRDSGTEIPFDAVGQEPDDTAQET